MKGTKTMDANFLMRNLFCLLVFSYFTIGASAESIRIGAWNIENLHHKPFFKLRKFGTFRQPAHLTLLKSYAQRFGKDGKPADIVALQEVGTKAGAELLYPKADYDIIMSPRWKNDNAPKEKGDVYTAIAIRKSSGVKVLEIDPIEELAVPDEDGHLTRMGSAALLEAGNAKFWFVSLHLKSSCSHIKDVSGVSNKHCKLLWQQAPLLTKWVEQKRASGEPVILAGDFNRRFRQWQLTGQYWTAINGGDLTMPWFAHHPVKVTRKCATRKGDHNNPDNSQPIDWILVDVKLEKRFVDDSFWETRFKKTDVDAAKIGSKSTGLSDHCPISIDLTTD